jgi:hypothetical protein
MKNPSREQFEISLIHIEEMQKTTYQMEELTVSKFLLLEKKFNAYQDRMKAKTI